MVKNGGINGIFIIFYGISVAYALLQIKKGIKKKSKELRREVVGFFTLVIRK